MIKKYNNISLIAGIPGILLQIGGRMAVMKGAMEPTRMGSTLPLMVLVGDLAILVGTALLIVGFAYYAKAKNRSPWWCLLGLLSCLGLLILACLKDRDNGEVVLAANLEPIEELEPIVEPQE